MPEAPAVIPPPVSPPPAPPPAGAPPAPGPQAGGSSTIEENPYAELDAAFTKAGTPPPATPPAGAAPKPDGVKPAPPKPGTPPPKEAVVPKSVREMWNAETSKLKSELKEKTDAVGALEAKIADFEKRGKETEALTERLSTLEKERDQLKAEIRVFKQEASPEFIKKYEEPFQRLADRARSVIEKIQIEDAESGTSRFASWKGDFARIYALDEFTALREFKRVFGDDGGQIAHSYYKQLHELNDAKETALSEERENWKKKQEEEDAQRIQTREQTKKFYLQANQELSEKIEDYHDSPDDKELVEVRNKAYAAFDAPVKTLRDKVIKDAHNRQRVAAFAVQKVMLRRKDERISELEAELEKAKPKPPGTTKRPGGTPAAPVEDDFETGLRKHMQGV